MYVVGIDIGGQTTKLGVVDARGTVLAQTVIRTDTYTDITPYIGELAVALNKIIAEAGVEGKVKGIGVGAPNGNYYTGTIENAVNLSWGGTQTIEFAKLLSEAMNGLPVALTNDANAAILGEVKFGIAKNYKNVVMLTLGTGVGGGLYIENKLYEGNKGKGAELGHALFRYNGRQCTCGRKGCIEAYCSASALSPIIASPKIYKVSSGATLELNLSTIA